MVRRIAGQAVHGLLRRLSATEIGQRYLERTADVCHRHMGIGSGHNAASSGEFIVVEKLKRLHAEIGRPLCVFDVGANQGQFLSLICAGLSDIPHTIHAFEPCQETFALLSAKTSQWPNVRLNKLALGKDQGTATIYYDGKGSGLASLTRRRLDHLGVNFGQSEEIRITTLDRYCAENEIAKIDLLKLDVEGHELDVLRGGEEMFRAKR